jgi:hypothetical protein
MDDCRENVTGHRAEVMDHCGPIFGRRSNEVHRITGAPRNDRD